MKPSAANNKLFFAATGLVAALAAACLWFFTPREPAPDAVLLARRVNAAVALGWGWLHTKDMQVVDREKKGDKYAVTFRYLVVIDEDETALPPEERERFRRFLPMCSDLPIARGISCPVLEEMMFANTEEYGWMPELFIRFRPEMLPAIADWKEPGP